MKWHLVAHVGGCPYEERRDGLILRQLAARREICFFLHLSRSGIRFSFRFRLYISRFDVSSMSLPRKKSRDPVYRRKSNQNSTETLFPEYSFGNACIGFDP